MDDGVHDPEDDEAPPQSDAERCPACEGSGNVMRGLGGG
jgi:hypothetical protein